MAIDNGYKPSRQFNADYGDKSINNAGPDAIERDIDILMNVFNPDAIIIDPITGEEWQGGIGDYQIQDKTISIDKLKDLSPDTATTDDPSIGDISFKGLIGWFANLFKSITGGTYWYSSPEKSLKTLDSDIGGLTQSVATDISDLTAYVDLRTEARPNLIIHKADTPPINPEGIDIFVDTSKEIL